MDESVDLIYLDPPFNSNRNYNVLFKDESGTEADCRYTRSKTPGTGTNRPRKPITMANRKKRAQLSELERLNLFVEVAESLGKSSYVTKPSGAQLKMRWQPDTAFVIKFDRESDQDHLRSFLTDFRKFILKDDPVFFFGICNILFRRLPKGDLREIVENCAIDRRRPAEDR